MLNDYAILLQALFVLAIFLQTLFVLAIYSALHTSI